ncbi:MAG: 5-carboxymethyl-2-hydroxymuconate isomerase [Pseudomonadota bacterium]
MPHLSIEYDAETAQRVDVKSFCVAMRDAMAATGVFPLGGIRVRGFQADCTVIADGDPAHGFVDMSLRMGAGRDKATRLRVAEALYAAAETALRPVIGAAPFMLSLELREIDPDLSIKRWSTVHGHLAAGAGV